MSTDQSSGCSFWVTEILRANGVTRMHELVTEIKIYLTLSKLSLRRFSLLGEPSNLHSNTSLREPREIRDSSRGGRIVARFSQDDRIFFVTITKAGN